MNADYANYELNKVWLKEESQDRLHTGLQWHNLMLKKKKLKNRSGYKPGITWST